MNKEILMATEAMETEVEAPTSSPLPQNVTRMTPDLTHTMDFLEAMRVVTTGGRVTRVIWGTSDFYVQMFEGVMRLMKEDGLFHDWIISEADIYGHDWQAC